MQQTYLSLNLLNFNASTRHRKILKTSSFSIKQSELDNYTVHVNAPIAIMVSVKMALIALLAALLREGSDAATTDTIIVEAEVDSIMSKRGLAITIPPSCRWKSWKKLPVCRCRYKKNFNKPICAGENWFGKDEIVANIEKTGRIVGGTKASNGDYPWFARATLGEDWGGCGGSLVSPEYVLTAAHVSQLVPPFLTFDRKERFTKVLLIAFHVLLLCFSVSTISLLRMEVIRSERFAALIGRVATVDRTFKHSVFEPLPYIHSTTVTPKIMTLPLFV